MYAMQYVVTLPTDYDMRIIRDRVARTGSVFDGFPGLGFKAYLMRERALGAPTNEYAPFYLWDDLDGMRAFCWGEPGYSAIVRDFGRRPINDYTVVGVAQGASTLSAARSMSLAHRPLPTGAPADTVPALAQEYLTSGDRCAVYRVAAVDVTTWTLVTGELSTRPVDEQPEGAYEVLRVSSGRGGDSARDA